MTKTHGILKTLPLVLLGLLLAPSAFAQQVTANVSSRFLARGEYARLEIVAEGREPDIAPSAPVIPGVKIDGGRAGSVSRGFMGRSLEFSYEFIISSYEVGRHVVPPINLIVGGQRVQTQPLEFWVFDPDQLQLSEVEAGGHMVTYFASFHTTKIKPFEGEALPTEIKIYIPLDLARAVEDWGVPEFERDNVTSWRFEPTDSRGQVNILGKTYLALAYPSTMAPSKAGKVGIGPATLRLTTQEVAYDQGFPRTAFKEVYLKIPKLELEAMPLPEGAPKGFDNAIGQFQLKAEIDKPEINDGESLGVNLTVTGSGNLDTLHAPKLSDETGWKVYTPIAIPRGEERRRLSGTSAFHQGLLPLEMKPLVPPFQLVYFDPEDGAYKTAMSEPIAIKMSPSTKAPLASQGPPPALQMPIERMSDILSIIKPAQLTVPAVSSLPGWLGHAIGGLIALGLLAKTFWNRVQPRFQRDPVRESKAAEIKQIAAITASDNIAFLKAAGSFIERWQGANPDPELKAVLADRDRICFRADKSTEPLPSSRRGEILSLLRKVSLLAVMLLTLGFTGRAQAADIAAEARDAFNAGKYEDAIRLWQSAGDYKDLSADVLYNIGNASYRLGSPGHAALYYRRALGKNATLEEARQNLRFIERKFGSISVQYSDYQHALAKIPLTGWNAMLWGGVWFTGLSLLVFPATRHGARIRYVATALLIFGPLLASLGALGRHYYPNDSIFAPIERQAVIISPGTTLHADAARTSPEVIDAPQGSLCEIIRVSGKWAYVSFATKTRGWVPVSSFEKLVPDSPPGIPKVTRPPADDSNA